MTMRERRMEEQEAYQRKLERLAEVEAMARNEDMERETREAWGEAWGAWKDFLDTVRTMWRGR